MKKFDCHKCFLRDQCTQPVMGEGSLTVKVILIGEAPGRIEDARKRPFIGPAGQLLMHIIGKLGLKREDFYITNVLKCWPSRGLPTAEKLQECMDACLPILDEEIHRYKAKIVLLGGVALKRFIGNSLIAKYNEMEVDKGIWATYHPAFLLRNPAKTKELSIARTIYKACKAAGLKMKPQGEEYGFFHYKTF